MKNEIMNMLEIIRSDANEAVKLAKEIARIPGVEINSIRVWSAPTNEEIAPHRTVEFIGLHGRFNWHDHTININENFNGKLIIAYDDAKIGEIYWSAMTGTLHSLPEWKTPDNKPLSLTKAQRYILDCLWRAINNISPKGKPYEKISLPKKIIIGEYTLYADGATIYAEYNGETIRVMGNTWRGLLWTTCDPRVAEIQSLIKKAFIVY